MVNGKMILGRKEKVSLGLIGLTKELGMSSQLGGMSHEEY